jgi:uncharacterized membrane protein YbhN (UPF0104 family)
MRRLDVVSPLRVLRTRYLSLILLVVVLGALTWYAVSHRSEFAGLATVRPLEAASLPALWVLHSLVRGIRRRELLHHLGVDTSPREWFGLGVAAGLANLLTPFKGGSAVEAVYLKKRYRFPIALFGTYLLASEAVFLTVAAFMGLLVSGLIYWVYHQIDYRIAAFFGGVSGVGIALLFLSPAILPQRKGRLLSAIHRGLVGWRNLRKKPSLLLYVALLGVASLFVHACRTYLAYRALSIDVGFLPILLIATTVQFATFVKLTPGNVGIIEGATALVSRLLGIGFEEGLAAAGALRASSLLMFLTVGPLMTYLLGRELERAQEAEDPTPPAKASRRLRWSEKVRCRGVRSLRRDLARWREKRQ